MTLDTFDLTLLTQSGSEDLELITQWLSQNQPSPVLVSMAEFPFNDDTRLHIANASTSTPPIQQYSISPDIKQEITSPSTPISTDIAETPLPSQTPKRKRALPPPRKTIPRPPNAWILYRSAKIKERCDKEWRVEYAQLQGKDSQLYSSTLSHQPSSSSNAPTTVQAFMSKRIADLWRSESDQVKDHYYMLSKTKKMEHAQLYPDYKFAPVKMPRSEPSESADTDSSNIKVEGGTIKKVASANGTPSSGTEHSKPTKTKRVAKAKMKSMPELSIDVEAAERNHPFTLQTLLGSSSPTLFSQSQQNESVLSSLSEECLQLNTNTRATQQSSSSTSLDLFMRDDIPPSECASTSDLPSVNGFTLWTASPLPVTPVEDENATAASSDTCMVDVATTPAPIKTEISSSAATASAEGVLNKKSDITEKRTKKKKSPLRRQTRLFPLTPASISPKKKLKKALICRDAQLIAKSKALQSQKETNREKARNENRSPVFYTRAVQEQQYDSNASMDSGAMDFLLRSYDAQGPSSDVEEALLCADSLIESFSTMPAWSPDVNQQFSPFSSNRLLPSSSQGAIESAPASMTSFEIGNWSLYSHPMIDTSAPTTFASDIASHQIMQASFAQSSIDEHICSTQMTPFDQSIGNETCVELEDHDDLLQSCNDLRGSWTLNDHEWDALLQETMCKSVSPPQEEISTTFQETPSASLYNLAQIELEMETVTPKEVELPSTTSVPASTSSNLFSKSSTGPALTLHGTFTEEDLLLKLEKLREVKAREVLQRQNQLAISNT